MADFLISKPRAKAVFISEATNQRSRDNISLLQGGVPLESGTLLTLLTTGTGRFGMEANSQGNPTSSMVKVGASAPPGYYTIKFTSATKFTVVAPDGNTLGTGTMGTEFSKGDMTFTLTAGNVPTVDGDTGYIGVSTVTGKYLVYEANGAIGSADAVLLNSLPAYAGEVKAAALVRDAELNRFELVGLDDKAEKTLRAQGLIVRGTADLPHVSTPAL